MIDEKGDVGFFEDAVTVISNLLHIEVHSINSYFMNHDDWWLEINNQARKDRTELMNLVLKHDDGSQFWCFCKHSLITIIGYVELGNRMMSLDNKEKAKYYFDKAGSWLEKFLERNLEPEKEPFYKKMFKCHKRLHHELKGGLLIKNV